MSGLDLVALGMVCATLLSIAGVRAMAGEGTKALPKAHICPCDVCAVWRREFER